MRSAAIKGVGWAGISQISRQVFQFATLAVLAKILDPEDFGLLAMCTVITRFMDLFKDLGTGAALIQKETTSEDFLSSVFWVNAGLGISMMLLLVAGAPLVALLYNESQIIPILRVLAIGFTITGLGITLKAYLEKHLSFRSLSIAEITGTTLGSIAAIVIALQGGRVWSLVALSLVSAGITTLMFWLLSRWRPQLTFRWAEVKSIMGYSLNFMGYNVFNFLSRNADYFLIGRFLGVQALGYYTMAYQLVVYPLRSISSVVSRVMFPVLTKMQHDIRKMSATYLRTIGSIALITFPLMFGLWVLAEPFVKIVLGEQWAPAIPIILILAPIGVTQSIGSTVGSIYLAKGKTDWMFIWGIGSSIVVVTAFVIGIQWGIEGVAWSYLIATLSLHFFNLWIPLRLIDLGVLDVYKTLMPTFLCASLMLLFLVTLGTLTEVQTGWWTFLGMVGSGVLVYRDFFLVFESSQT